MQNVYITSRQDRGFMEERQYLTTYRSLEEITITDAVNTDASLHEWGATYTSREEIGDVQIRKN